MTLNELQLYSACHRYMHMYMCNNHSHVYATLHDYNHAILWYFRPSVTKLTYSATLLNGHPSTAATCAIMDTSECPDRISIDFNTFKTGHPAILYNGHYF